MSSAARKREEVSSNAAFLDEGPPRSDYRAVTTPSYRLKAGEANKVASGTALGLPNSRSGYSPVETFL